VKRRRGRPLRQGLGPWLRPLLEQGRRQRVPLAAVFLGVRTAPFREARGLDGALEEVRTWAPSWSCLASASRTDTP